MDWNIYKKARNTVNNAVKMCKSKYYKEACFTDTKDPGKLWSTINEISSRKLTISIVKNLKVGQQELTCLVVLMLPRHLMNISLLLATS